MNSLAGSLSWEWQPPPSAQSYKTCLRPKKRCATELSGPGEQRGLSGAQTAAAQHRAEGWGCRAGRLGSGSSGSAPTGDGGEPRPPVSGLRPPIRDGEACSDLRSSWRLCFQALQRAEGHTHSNTPDIKVDAHTLGKCLQPL